jgi:hypothetical protein
MNITRIAATAGIAVALGLGLGACGATTRTVIIKEAAKPAVLVTRTAPPAPSTKIIIVKPAPAITDPWAVVSAYYGAVESQDYTEAWNLYWVAGYANTGDTDLQESGESGATVYITVNAVYLATGSVQTYAGTYTVDGGLIASASMTLTS